MTGKPALSDLSYRALPNFFYSEVPVAKYEKIKPVILNERLAKELGFEKKWLGTLDGLSVLSGQSSLAVEGPIAMAYGGHQFGHWSGMLGDGRAMLVAERKDAAGHLHELHLKGSGQTPYSRRGDGKATLGSAIREYIVSEAMHALGVPTSRSLSVILTGEKIIRDGYEPGAVLCRTARSHIRVGTFQIAAASGDSENVKALADFAIDRLEPSAPKYGPERYGYFLEQVSARQAELVAKWMGFGFIHGVMNTDNMCVSGETIDYGPCAFIDEFHPGKTFSSIDRNGRYAWNRQAEMAHWNLMRLAESLLPLLGQDEEMQMQAAEQHLNIFVPKFEAAFQQIMANKLGLSRNTINDDDFLNETFKAMTLAKVDFTLFFRRLTQQIAVNDFTPLLDLFRDRKIGEAWLSLWKSRVSNPDLEAMQAANPIIIARNHRVEEAIAAANNSDFDPFKKLLAAISSPFQERPEFADFEVPPSENEIVHQTFCGT
ncbi:MAG: YdiU family protein [Hellea sp.]|nr:YdiU family protein [Hellea sp.]